MKNFLFAFILFVLSIAINSCIVVDDKIECYCETDCDEYSCWSVYVCEDGLAYGYC